MTSAQTSITTETLPTGSSNVTTNTHSMQTRSKFGISKKRVFAAATTLPNSSDVEPTSYTQASKELV